MGFDVRETRAAVRHLRAADPIVRDVIAAVGPFRMRTERRRFQALARSIIAQQISGKAARSIWNRLSNAVRPGQVTAAAIAALSLDDLRALGVSPQKAGYLQNLSDHVLQRSVRLDRMGRMPDADVIAELIRVRGIGVWTAQMFLMFSLGRLDVLPHDDLGIRSAIRQLYALPELPGRDQCETIACPWRPYATVACWYLWRSTELPGPT